MFIPPAILQADPWPAAPEVVATLPVKSLLAEDLAFDSATGRWFVSSVHRREILVKTPGSAWRTFASRNLAGVLALGIDLPRRRLWATSVGLPQAADLAPGDQGHSTLVAFDLDSGREVRRAALEGKGHALGDMALAPDGTVFVSDGQGGGVYRLDPEGAGLVPLVASGTFRSPQTPVVVEGGLLVPDYAKGLAFVSRAGGAARWLAVPAVPAGADLRGLDGMAIAGRRVYAVQNGASPNRVLALDLDAGFTKVERITALLQVAEATHCCSGAARSMCSRITAGTASARMELRARICRRSLPPRILKVRLP